MNDAASFSPPDEAPPARPNAFFGNERAFWRLLTRGAVLLLVTLGIYRFWLVTDVRRSLWNNTVIAGEHLEYIGTARELLLGFLIAIVLLVPVNVVLFLAALSGGTLGQLASVITFAVLGTLGQFAVYRARRYRLSRTVYRGLRFHQTGSAIRYAVCAVFWWAMIALTLGLAYPFTQAALERFKLRHTHYGDLQGRFEGSGWRLFFRGILFWIVVVVPLVLGLLIAIGMVDWAAVSEASQRSGTDMMSRIEGAGVAQAVVIGVIAIAWGVIAAALLYPAFQAMVLRWWISGLRFGKLTATSQLRTGAVYSFYGRFMWIALLAAVVIVVLAFIAFALVGSAEKGSMTSSALGITTLVVLYVIVALTYSTIYQATVRWRLWRHAFETLELSDAEVLDKVKATGSAGSAIGEGLADALNVGGI
jgi:uncharacterized membrane protein YjgN (DUF898 family)